MGKKIPKMGEEPCLVTSLTLTGSLKVKLSKKQSQKKNIPLKSPQNTLGLKF